MLTGMLSARALYKGIEGKDWEEMNDSCKVLEQGCGCQKTAGGSEGKSPVGHESSQGTDGKSFMIRLVKLTFWEEVERDWTCGTQLWPWTRR